MASFHPLLVLFFVHLPRVLCQLRDFISIDCGGMDNYTDGTTGLLWIPDTEMIAHGKSVVVENPSRQQLPYQRRREFAIDNNKYCYNLRTKERRRYLIRASFLYGSPGDGGAYPKFLLYLDATKWATVTILDASNIYTKEIIIWARSSSIDVCLCCSTTGFPFISTLELRPLNLSMYATDFEDNFFLKVAARVNFGAPNKDVVRYPDDPYDRIWDSDLARRQNYLVGEAPGTERVSTLRIIDTQTREYPPVKVMQTAVLGTEGTLSYRLNLEDFPANARAFAYFAEIEELGIGERRKFKMIQPYMSDYSNAVVNIAENANGSYRLYEPSYMNVTLQFVLSFSFVKMRDSTRGPLLNAIEISKYLRIAQKTDEGDVAFLSSLRSMTNQSFWAGDTGDPCIPIQWQWVNCSSTSPPRIIKIYLSRMNLTGEISLELNNMKELNELWLDGNYLTGPIPDISNLVNLRIMHLENNRLTGTLPSYLGTLPSLQELYLQNNSFTGELPSTLLNKRIIFMYVGNPKLSKGAENNKRLKLICGSLVGVLAFLLIFFIGNVILFHKTRKSPVGEKDTNDVSFKATMKSLAAHSQSGDVIDENTCYISFSQLEDATDKFSKKIGQGSFGPVYYGRFKDGKEVAVKLMADLSVHGARQFINEVALLSRIHHRNLVPLIGYCKEQHHRILVYEYMHNGTLRDHIQGLSEKKPLDWLVRLCIAEDAAKGLEYLHNGCNPSIIHRDVKTSNILLDVHMKAKVSDFGLSRQADEDLTHVSSMARGTVGYLDPEYYGNQQLTEKSDVYSFGVVLLELISGRKPVSTEDFGIECNIVHWARALIRKGDVSGIVDPVIVGAVKLESVWRVVEVAIQCVEQHSFSRPKMQEIIMAIQDAVKIEKSDGSTSASSGGMKVESSRRTLLTSFLEGESPVFAATASLHPAAR